MKTVLRGGGMCKSREVLPKLDAIPAKHKTLINMLLKFILKPNNK